MPKIGLSKPYVANYSNTGTTVTYSSVGVIGRYTELQINLDDSEDNDFYSDNAVSENDNQFPGGTAAITTDDLSPEAMVKALGMVREQITGVSGVTTEGAAWIVNNDNQQLPFLGLGGIIKKKQNGAIGYVAVVLDKVRFRNMSNSFTTQGRTIEWQTSSLTADIYRSDRATHDWRRFSTVFPTEAEAEAALVAYLGGTT
ncbi:MAG: hypothetical protein IJI27_09975 [Oscillospiraceae bacterium]|nr:hypothetical protein [Oscillospiraceae bacterium]